MKRSAVVSLAIATSALAASVIGFSPALSAGAKAASKTLRINTKTLLLTAPETPPAPGDRLAFYEQATGGDSGHDYVDCVVMNDQGEALCHAEFVLARGAISADAVINVNAASLDASGPITGGTGRYNGARGTVSITGPATSTRFAFHFLNR
jgi:hypothetical protein